MYALSQTRNTMVHAKAIRIVPAIALLKGFRVGTVARVNGLKKNLANVLSHAVCHHRQEGRYHLHQKETYHRRHKEGTYHPHKEETVQHCLSPTQK
ncbi:hypothetical protein PR202_gb03854 [Eleusine coracana subsp. coracana]|uniref:Uncharacterized protein n=1 Tax=Eleusine coracana subsp. coracana TaxID=191504 RepID=A0AAV5E2V2_ELECO|nr:hypothetical protein PR202_gb03854 [Eleusine coracana subsp. coracana]